MHMDDKPWGKRVVASPRGAELNPGLDAEREGL
jgi:hypothetical protein